MKRLIWMAVAAVCAVSGRELTHTAHFENVLGTSLDLRIGGGSAEGRDGGSPGDIEAGEDSERL